MDQTDRSSRVLPGEIYFTRRWMEAVARSTSTVDTVQVRNAGGTASVPSSMPFSFLCGNTPSTDWMHHPLTVSSPLGWQGGLRKHLLTWREQRSGLECRLELTDYEKYPAVEWVLWLTNTGAAPTPVLGDVNALDMRWTTRDGGLPLLHRSRGSDEQPDDFRYRTDELGTVRRRDRVICMDAGGSEAFGKEHDGRSSVAWLPFFNLQTGAEGVITAVGWSGQWQAAYAHDGAGTVRVTAGMQDARTSLLPGETIRTPRILLLFWTGEPFHGNNVLRRFILEHHTPHHEGRPLEAPISWGAWGGTPTAGHLDTIRRIREKGLRYDVYWVDAGWYGTGTRPCPNVFDGDWPVVGDWRVNRSRHPDGLRPIRDAARNAGMRFLLWIETERARQGTPVTLEHPEWFLTRTGAPPQPEEDMLLDLGQEAARQWAIETVSSLIEEHGIDIYREDFNFNDSLETFRAHDAEGRRGLTEARFIRGLYDFWDELLRRHPGLQIDNCASGGRRIDLETVSRSVALWRTDYACFPKRRAEAAQVHGMGLSYWVPLSGTGIGNAPGDTYAFRSALAAGMSFSADDFALSDPAAASAYPWDWHRRMLDQALRAKAYYYGDFHPLTACDLDDEAWLAYQLHRPGSDDGMLLAFRRPGCVMTRARLRLSGLQAGARYLFEDADGAPPVPAEGTELLQAGVELVMPEPRSSRLVFYGRA